ncbi:MAG: peptide chain release factor N(5)-glutamine methyltransferase [Pseudomonadota bacterium]
MGENVLQPIDATTVAGAIRSLARRLAAAGIATPRSDARLLVEGLTGVERWADIRDPELALAPGDEALIEAAAVRRLAREPVSRILGRRGFYGRDFAISPATLDPRPDTETLVSASLELVAERGWREQPIRILDVGTGSGAILVTLLAELPHAVGLGTDISVAALEVAADNARRHGVGDRAAWQTCRSLDGVTQQFDLLVANPPYIATDEIAGLEPEVRAFDPLGALDGGSDGLDVYREIAAGLIRVVPDGWVVVEVGAGQAAAVGEILARDVGSAAGGPVRSWCDLSGHERCVALETHS